MTNKPIPPGDRPGTAPATDPAACTADEPAAQALPIRIRGVPLAVRQAQPQADPAILRRVLDGLNQL